MTVISSNTDADELTMTIVAEFDAPPERVWDVWEDARKLERWWGPPGYPATFTRHEFTVGGQSRYYMTGPEGRGPGGWWRLEVVAHLQLDRMLGMGMQEGMGMAIGQIDALLERVAA